jgi:site-specific recombinase XerD
MDVDQTIDSFLRHLKAIGYAKTTIINYTRNLQAFVRYLETSKINDLKKVTDRVILDYQQKVMNEPISLESKALKLRAVKRLFEHLVKTHKLLINPFEGIALTSFKGRKIGAVLTIEEMKRLLDQPDLLTEVGMRNRAIMEMLYSTGIRIDEFLSLEIYHADLKDKVLYIRKGKGRKQRVTPMGKNAVKYLNAYLQNVRSHHGRSSPKERALFLNRFGSALSGNSIRAFLTKYRTSAGIIKPVSPHTLRRTCATHLLQQGADIRHIQELLGHERLSTTQIYTKVMPVEVKKTHNRTHPKL